MNTQSKPLLHSPFARRLLVLFVFSAVIPVSILGGFIYLQAGEEIAFLERTTENRTGNRGLAVDGTESPRTAARFWALPFSFIVLAAGFGLLLGIVAIRRYLAPLDQLTAGSKRIAHNDFDVRIDIDGDDEWERLGDAFNHMTRQLKKKFATLSTLSEIDRLILSSQTLDQIGEVLLSRIDTLINCDLACIWFAENDSNELTTIIRDISAAEPVATSRSAIANDTIQGIANLAGNIDLGTHMPPTNYLAPLIARGVTNGYAVTIPVDAAHVANFFIGSKARATLDQDDVRQLLELTHRAAIALSNSVWRGKLYYQAHFDTLTQLPNRRMFKGILDAALSRARREQHSVGVLFIDLDEFKDVNDSLGHVAGDDLLVVVADRLRNAVRSSDTVARLGGDEFVVIVPDLDGSETHALADLHDLGGKLMATLEAPISVASQEIVVSASIGASFCPRDATNAEDLLRNADAAMYAVKERGRRGFCFYSDELNDNATAKLEVRSAIAGALERDEFELYFQPRIDSRSGRIVGCEGLIRWHHPAHGLVSPTRFIKEIERSGAIIEVGYWTLMAAATQLAEWQRRGFRKLPLSINLSPYQFTDRNLPATVTKVLDRSSVAPHLFELEITESAAYNDFERTLPLMNQLHDLGLTICIDDFGTGQSSLQTLQRMPIEMLKIDRSFVQEIGINARGEIVIESIIALGRSMGLQIVAEGIETAAQIAFLADRGCHVVQGYYYSEPVAAADFEKLLLSGARSVASVAPKPQRSAVTLVS